MKKSMFLILVLVYGQVFSQDIIIKRNGDTVHAKVKQIELERIIFNLPDNKQDSLWKSDVSYIVYPNGVTDTFSNISTTLIIHNLTLAERGTLDAKKNYRGYFGAMFGSMYPVYGLIPAIASSLTPPSYDRLNFPYPDLMEKYEYRNAYMKKAYRIKQTRTWEGFAIGTGLLLAIVGIVLLTPNH